MPESKSAKPACVVGRYVTVLLNGETGEVLGMVRHCSEAALSGFLIRRGRSWCRGAKVVVIDGSESL